MNFEYNKNLESRNYIDGVDFTANNPCIRNVYPAGAAGDLLASIINCHYSNTGSNYYGIDKNGQVIFRPSDYKITNTRQQCRQPLFNEQHFFDIATSLSDRNMNYSMCDQFIFSCHLNQNHHINTILEVFSRCKIICTYLTNSHGEEITTFMSELKNKNVLTEPSLTVNNRPLDLNLIYHPNILNVPFGALFQEKTYYEWYDKIIKFLNLNGRLICFDYIEYYIAKQHPKIKNMLINYNWQT